MTKQYDTRAHLTIEVLHDTTNTGGLLLRLLLAATPATITCTCIIPVSHHVQ